MEFLKRLFRRADYVLLRLHNGNHKHKPVEWFCGKPFAAPYLPETRCELLPGGGVIGSSYISAWLPASEGMERWFLKTPNTGVDRASGSGRTQS